MRSNRWRNSRKKTDAPVSLASNALDDLIGKWDCTSNETGKHVYHLFNNDGSFRSGVDIKKAGSGIMGSYKISSNHTLVLESRETDPPEVYIQIMELSRSRLVMSSPYVKDDQTFQCGRMVM